MEITIPKSELSKILHLTLAIAEKKSTMPILGNLLLSAEDKTLRITASDIEVTAVASAAASVKKKGAITVAAKMFSYFFRRAGVMSANFKPLLNDSILFKAVS